MADYLILFKLISVVSIFLIAFIGGIIPLRLAHYFKDPKTMSYANCLSAGILLGASLIHLLFDAEEETFDYPFAHLCCGVGFFTAFMMEKVVFSHKHEHGIEGQSGHGEHLPRDVMISAEPDEHEVELQSLTSSNDRDHHDHRHDDSTHTSNNTNINNNNNNNNRSINDDNNNRDDRIRTSLDSTTDSTPMIISSKSSLLAESDTSDDITEVDDDDEDDRTHKKHKKKQHAKKKKSNHGHGHGHGHDEDDDDDDDHHNIHGEQSHRVAYILFSVLSLESFISGSALGIANSPMSALGLAIAIITHIWAEAFALCASFMKSKMAAKKLYRWIAFFSAMTPFGIFFGMALKSILAESEIALIISSLLISFAAGTFLYVAIVEIITEEFEHPTNKWTKLNLLLIGYAFMSALAKFV